MPQAARAMDDIKIKPGQKFQSAAMDEYNAAAFDNYNEKVLEKCEGCGRTFNPESLIKHQKMCLKGSGSTSKRANHSPRSDSTRNSSGSPNQGSPP